MNSWWQLGEAGGYHGTNMRIDQIVCAFCGERGHFELVFNRQKKKPNSDKALNFDVYQCVNCSGFVHVLWSTNNRPYASLYDYKILPWALDAKPEPSPNWPDGVKRFWIQAHHSLTNENWDAANLMARSAVQFIVRDKHAMGNKLKAQIDDLVTKGVLHPLMGEWGHEVRLLANESAHPDAPAPVDLDPHDVNDIVNFLDSLLL
jgi:uncharacterized protein DUF4145